MEIVLGFIFVEFAVQNDQVWVEVSKGELQLEHGHAGGSVAVNQDDKMVRTVLHLLFILILLLLFLHFGELFNRNCKRWNFHGIDKKMLTVIFDNIFVAGAVDEIVFDQQR